MSELKLRHFSKLGVSLEVVETTVEYMPHNKAVKPQQRKTLVEFQKREKEIYDKTKVSIYKFYHKIYPIYKEAITNGYRIYNNDIESLNKMLDELLPKVKKGDELDGKIALMLIYVYDSNIIGLEFICSWDEEHGLGVLLQNFEVKKIGLGEVAYY